MSGETPPRPFRSIGPDVARGLAGLTALGRRDRGRSVDRGGGRRPAAQRGLRGRDRGRRPGRRRALCERFRPDLVVLDLMLPGLDGIEVCKQIQRERPVPVLMLTARDSETDLLVGLAVGADDYMTKPFSARELVARVHALLRRVDRARPRPAEARRRSASATSSSTSSARRVRRERRARAPHADRVRPAASTSRRAPAGSRRREELLGEVWGYDVPSGARTVDSHIRVDPPQARRRRRAHRARRRLRGRGRCRVHVRTARRPPERPLDPLPTLKLKLSVVILGGGRGDGRRLLGRRQGRHVAVGQRRDRRPASRSWSCRFLVARAHVAAARDGRGDRGDGARATSRRRVTATSHDEIGTLARAFNQMAAELAETDRHAPRPRRQRAPRAAHADHRAAGRAREHRRRRRRARSRDASRTMLAQVERLGRLVQQLLDLSRLESGTLRARPPRVRGRADARARGARVAAARGRRSRSRSSVEPADLAARRPTPSACTRSSRTWSRTRCGTRRAAARVEVRAPARHRRRDDRSDRRRARASPRPSDPRLRTLLPRRLRARRRATAAPASASRSRAGSSSCTAARSAPRRASRTAAAWS